MICIMSGEDVNANVVVIVLHGGDSVRNAE